MIDFAMALADLREERQDGFSQVACVSRRADLVADNAQFRLFGTEAQHGLDEIVAERGIKPGGADDEAAAAAAAYSIFAVALAPAIGRQRMPPVGLPVAGSFPSIEHIFGGNVDQGGAVAESGAGQDAGARGIDEVAQAGFAFSCIYIGVGGTVDDGADVLSGKHPVDGAAVADIEFAHRAVGTEVGENEIRLSLRQQAEFGAELPEGAGNQYFLHRYAKNLCKDKN